MGETPPANNGVDLLTQPVPRLLRSLAVPVGIGFFFNTMFNVVDTFYGGLISTQALAAMSLSFPVFFLIMAVGSGISTGATALTGHALGAGDTDAARLYAVQTISFAVIHGVLLAGAGLCGASFLFTMLGASGEYLRLSLSYMNVIFAGTVFFVLNQALNSILNASGNTKCFRNFLVLGFFLNLGLDPWFMYGGFGVPALGLAGVALATVVVQCIGNVYLLRQVLQGGLVTSGCWPMLLPRRRIFIDLARQGFPASLNMLTVALGIFVITWFLGRFGRDAVAAYGIATRIEQVALLPVMGLNIATLALVAQNNGARLFRRVKAAIKTALYAGMSIMGIGTVLVFFCAAPLMHLFTRDPNVAAIGTVFLRIESFVFSAYVILYICVFALQGLKKPMFAIWIGLYRQIGAPLLAFYLLAYHLGWGLLGIWWGIFIVTWSAALIALIYIRSTVRLMLRDEALEEGLPGKGL